MQEDRMLTLQDVAHIANVSEMTVRRWIKTGQLAATQLGGRYRVTRSDLQNFLAKHRKEVPPQDD